ncbi:hypothetical protein HK104_003963 [Borealophlyctis nickersoniae]|nr:hypothetical protein HK104_003963 [Borealophlyctis nickersoniae]
METLPVTALPHTVTDRTVESFAVDAIANVQLLLPPHRLLPLDDPLHLDRHLHTNLHGYYDPKVHNAAYLALASPEEWERDTTPPEEPALIVLVSKMAHRKEGERFGWQSPNGVKRSVPVYYGLGAAVKTAGVGIETPTAFRSSYHPVRAGNAISIGRFHDQELSLNAFIEFRMSIDTEAKGMDVLVLWYVTDSDAGE